MSLALLEHLAMADLFDSTYWRHIERCLKTFTEVVNVWLCILAYQVIESILTPTNVLAMSAPALKVLDSPKSPSLTFLWSSRNTSKGIINYK